MRKPAHGAVYPLVRQGQILPVVLVVVVQYVSIPYQRLLVENERLVVDSDGVVESPDVDIVGALVRLVPEVRRDVLEDADQGEVARGFSWPRRDVVRWW